jgi:hypothetical protein
MTTNLTPFLHSETNEWYSPLRYIDMVRKVFGGPIDLDPTSCEEANKVIQAKTIFTIKDDTINKDWIGKIFLNPPYGRNVYDWALKFAIEYDKGNMSEGIILVNSFTSSKCVQFLLSRFSVCFCNHRIKFYNEKRKKKTPKDRPLHSNVFFYAGNNKERFKEIFSTIGIVFLQ